MFKLMGKKIINYNYPLINITYLDPKWVKIVFIFHVQIQKVLLEGGLILTTFFLVDEGRPL